MPNTICTSQCNKIADNVCILVNTFLIEKPWTIYKNTDVLPADFATCHGTMSEMERMEVATEEELRQVFISCDQPISELLCTCPLTTYTKTKGLLEKFVDKTPEKYILYVARLASYMIGLALTFAACPDYFLGFRLQFPDTESVYFSRIVGEEKVFTATKTLVTFPYNHFLSEPINISDLNV